MVKLDHFRMTKSSFPESNLTLSRNYCRNYNNSPKGPWCVVDHSKSQWEYCNIPTCERDLNNCKDTVEGYEYLGKINISVSGKNCLHWKFHLGSSEYNNYKKYMGNPENYCRNMNKSNLPWCYVKDGHIKAESCNIPLCETELSQQEYFGKADVFKELKNHTKLISFKDLVDYLLLIFIVRPEHWTTQSQRKTSVWSTPFEHQCQKDIDQFNYCDLLKIYRTKLQIRLVYICNAPLKAMIIISPLQRSRYRYKCILGPRHRVQNNLNPNFNKYKNEINLHSASKYKKIPSLRLTGFFFLLLENALPYAVAGPGEVIMAISQVGKGCIGFIGNEKYLEEEYQIYLNGFYTRISKNAKFVIINIDDTTISVIEEEIMSNNASVMGIWNLHKDFNEALGESLLSLVHRGLRLVIGLSPWSGHFVERSSTNTIKPFFDAAGLWPSSKTVSLQIVRILRKPEFESMPLNYLLDHALVNIKSLVQVSKAISTILFNISTNNFAFHDKYESLRMKIGKLYSEYVHFGKAYTPCVAKPILKNQKLEREFITLFSSILLHPFGNIFVAPGVSFYPGTVDLNTIPTVSVKLSLSIQFANEIIHLGYYLPPGHIIEVEAWIAKSEKCTLHVNYHLFDVMNQDTWYKWPRTWMDFSLQSGETVNVSFAFGGLLSVSCVENLETISLSLLRVVELPFFDIRINQRFQNWKGLWKRKVPWIILGNDAAVFVLPYIGTRNLFDPASIMGVWNVLIQQEFHLKGYDISKNRRELISTDLQIIDGYMHSGYPIGTLMTSVVNPRIRDAYLLDENYIRKYGKWGLLHEIGHNLQDSLFTFEGTEEVTNNIFTLVATETLTGVNSWSKNNGWASEGNVPIFVKYIKGGKFEDWKSNPFLALGSYAQLKNSFGWELYRQVFRRYTKLATQYAKQGQNITDNDKIQLWIQETSFHAKMNLCPFYELWRFPVDNSTRRQLEILPSFLPRDFLTEMVNKRVKKIISLYGGVKKVFREGMKIKSLVGPYIHKSRLKGKPAILSIEML